MADRAAGLRGADHLAVRCASTPRRRIESRWCCSRLACIGLLSLYAAGVTDLTWYIVAVVVAGLGRGALNYIPWSVYNYMPDVDEIVTGRRREGAFAGVMTFVRKFMQSIAIFVVTQILDSSGLIPGKNVQQPQSVVDAVVLLMGVGTLGILAFGFFVSTALPSQPRHACGAHGGDRTIQEHRTAPSRRPKTAPSSKI